MAVQCNTHLDNISLESLRQLLLPIILPPSSPRASFTNWGLSFHCVPQAVFVPENEFHCELILELARRQGRVVRAVGVGHSPSDIACTGDYMLRTDKLNKLLEVSKPFRICCCLISPTFQGLFSTFSRLTTIILFPRSTWRNDISSPSRE